jgi:transposase
LAAIVADRNRPRKHVERARIGLASADRGSAQRVAQSIGISRPTVWRWQQRFAEAGVEGLLRDKTRKPGKPPIAAETTARVVALTCTQPPHQATHWTGRAMAKATGISLSSVQRIWRAHRLQPHRLRTFKRSRDPGFAAKLADIVGLYVDPPAHAVVLSLDEKSQIQALDRTQPGLPIKPGRCQTMTHDQCFIADDTLERLPVASRVGKTLVGGIDLNKARMRQVVEALIALSPLPNGFTASDIAARVRTLSRQSLSQYGPRQAAYDLKKPRHDIKFDGYRMHTRLDRGAVRLLTRTGLDWTHKYPTIAVAVSSIGAEQAYLDGELCGVRPTASPPSA